MLKYKIPNLLLYSTFIEPMHRNKPNITYLLYSNTKYKVYSTQLRAIQYSDTEIPTLLTFYSAIMHIFKTSSLLEYKLWKLLLFHNTNIKIFCYAKIETLKFSVLLKNTKFKIPWSTKIQTLKSTALLRYKLYILLLCFCPSAWHGEFEMKGTSVCLHWQSATQVKSSFVTFSWVARA